MCFVFFFLTAKSVSPMTSQPRNYCFITVPLVRVDILEDACNGVKFTKEVKITVEFFVTYYFSRIL